MTVTHHRGFDGLPSFAVETVFVDGPERKVWGRFSDAGIVSPGPGFLYRSAGRSIEVDVVDVDAGLLTTSTDEIADLAAFQSFPYFSAFWSPEFLEAVTSPTVDWVRVEFEPSELLRVRYSTPRGEIVGSEEAGGELLSGSTILERVPGGWASERCQICGDRIGPAFLPFGYRRREDAATGLNSMGVWICEDDFERYVSKGSLAFVLGRRQNE